MNDEGRSATSMRPPDAKVQEFKHTGKPWGFDGIARRIERHYKRYRQKQVAHSGMEAWLEKVMIEHTCPDCKGSRLRSTRLMVKVNGKNPRTRAIGCGKVSEVDAVTGSGNDRVNLSGVGTDNGFGQRDLPGGFGHGTGTAADLGPGNDRYIGGKSAFNLVLAGDGDDHLTGGRFRDSLQGGSGNDSLASGFGRDILLGNSGNDKLNAGPDDDLLSGNAGDDVLLGGAGADLMGGGAGMDRLFGGPGPDQLIGGPGKDRLNGGKGNNTLVQDSPKK